MTTMEKRLQRKKNLIKIKKILKKFTILFLIGIIYLIEIPLYVVFIIIPLVLFIRFKYNIGSVLVILFFLFIFYYTPYSFYLEPSYWQFRNMCKLNELPNNEEKYNKILGYFDTDLESLDWEELNGRALKLTKGFNLDYIEGRLEYRVKVATIQKRRYDISVDLYTNTNNKGFSKETITHIETYGSWKTRRYFLERKYMTDFPFQAEWTERDISCTSIKKFN